jgi:hypothetical protein
MVRLSSYLAVFYVRDKLLALMNLAFFGCVFVISVVSEFLIPPKPYLGSYPSFPEIPLNFDFLLTVFSIFLFNLSVSAFTVVTLPGFVFFPLSMVFLLFRAVIWGLLLYYQPTWVFLIVVPTLVLEGEAYCFAAVAGMVVGASWIKSEWLFHDGNFSRVEAFKKALRECLVIYVFVVLFLFFAAVLEAVTLTMMV